MSRRGPDRNACPICGTAAVTAYTPFCSQGCRDRDLLRWLGEGYRIPGPSTPSAASSGLDSDDDGPL